MALHTQLPIYKVAYDLLSVAVDYVRNMPRPIISLDDGREIRIQNAVRPWEHRT